MKINLRSIYKKIRSILEKQTSIAKGNALVVFNFVLVGLQFLYILLRYKYVNEFIPLWQTQLWGDAMLAPKKFLFLLPFTVLGILLFGLLLEFLFRNYFARFLKGIILSFSILANVLITFSILHIIFVASNPFPPVISPLLLSLLIPFLIAFTATWIFTPKFISFAFENDVVTNPKIHEHPGMVLKRPSARGGGVLYTIIFLTLSIFFVGIPKNLLGFFVAIAMLGLLGYVDDFQNTHTRSVFKSLENPLLRLILMSSAVAVLILSGVFIKTIGNPSGGFLDLTRYFSMAAYFFTLVWVVWILNLLSWSNGIDGQYGGIIGITSILLCVLALRFVPLELIHTQVALMAAISAGIAFGFTKYMWYPSSLMWGFGATAAGLVIASLSILINTKIMVSVLILLIPFLDASVTFIRRILQKKSPLKGDRQHFHHLLLEMGWSIPQIAKLYWIATILFGIIGVFASDRYLVQTVLIVGGLVASIIVLVNLKSLKTQQQ